MKTRTAARWKTAVGLGVFIAFAQLSAFLAIGFSAWKNVTSPQSTALKMPLVVPFAQEFQGDVIHPICGWKFTGKMIMTSSVVGLRAVNLQTGRSRDIEMQSRSSPEGFVSNGERLWCCANSEIFEFDGKTITKLTAIPKGRSASAPFLYEQHLAMIRRDLNEEDRLVVYINGDWQDKGRVALPGPNRKWIVDEITGTSVLASRTSADSMANGSKFVRVHVIEAGGQYHLLQYDYQNLQKVETTTLSHRIGFDFITSPTDIEPVSALAPSNSTAETTGWALLDSKFASSFGSLAVFNNELIIANDTQIWQQRHTVEGRPIEFEQIAKVDLPEMGMINLISTPDKKSCFILASTFLDDTDVYRLENRKLVKLPYRIEGMIAPVKRC